MTFLVSGLAPAATYHTVAIITFQAESPNATQVDLMVGVYVNNVLEQEVKVGLGGTPVAVTATGSKALGNGTYNVGIRAKTSGTKTGVSGTIRIVVF
jgi:hypothetical protein